jgi:hypothetical protein
LMSNKRSEKLAGLLKNFLIFFRLFFRNNELKHSYFKAGVNKKSFL